jgi:membrane protein implicated in regulation of membrane protease activity
MQPSPFGLAQVGLAAGATILTAWVTEAAPELRVIAVFGGLALGTWAGLIDGGTLERRIDRRGGVVLYAEDSVPYALLLPLGVLALLPFAFGTMMLAVIRSSGVQLFFQLGMCVLAAMWLAHDVVVRRRLRRISARRGPLRVQWFYGRSVVGAEGMIGKTGEVTSSRAGGGYVRIGSELWRADSIDGSPLGEGRRVIVRRVDGLALIVERADPDVG